MDVLAREDGRKVHVAELIYVPDEVVVRVATDTGWAERNYKYVPADQLQGAVDDPRLLETLARVIENRHGTLHGIGSTLREALAEYKRGR